VGNNPLKYVDPTGHFPVLAPLIIVAAKVVTYKYLKHVALSGVASGAGYAMMAAATGTFSWKDLGIAVGTGMISGVLSPSMAITASGARLLGAVANTVQYCAMQITSGQAPAPSGMLWAAATGYVAGHFGGTFGTGSGVQFYTLTSLRSLGASIVSNTPLPSVPPNLTPISPLSILGGD
jgi:hypothetical protein